MSRTAAAGTPTTTTGGAAAPRLPWPSLLVLGAATFTMVTAEMLPTAVLAPMSRGLGVPDSQAAQLVSWWAAVVVLASFPLMAATRRFDRRDVMVVALVALGLSTVLTALAPGYAAAVVARLLGAASVGLLWATVNAHVAALVPERLLAASVSVVLGGATLGMVLGTPVARLLADRADWRVSFAALAGCTAVVAVLVRAVVGPGRRDTDPADGRSGGAARHSPAPMLALTALVAVVLVGHYGAYTFITLLAPAGVVPAGTSGVLLAFGVASAAGITAAGRVRERTRGALVVTVLATAAALAGLRMTEGHAVFGLLDVLAWALFSGALPALAQTEIMRRAGAESRATAGALIPVLFNGGIAVGAALAALLAAHAGVGAIPLPAALVVLAAGLGLAGLRRSRC